MVKVVFWGSLKDALGDQRECEVEAGTIKEMLDKLGEQYPKLRPTLDRGVAVSIDGVIYRQQRYREIPPDSEVYILPKMAGG